MAATAATLQTTSYQTPNIFGTTTVQGRTFDDIKIQTSKAGVSRPIVFGTARLIVGNIIATTSPRIVKTKEEQDGKGGPSVEVENEEVFRTYAIRICEGPVTGITRVWRNNELVYERDSTNNTQIENNNAFLQKAEFFLGGYDQMPSAVMQAAFGMSNVHAYRGTCYMVVDDENLTATGGAIPQYAFEVERCEGTALTSWPYHIQSSDFLKTSPEVTNFGFPTKIEPESIYTAPVIDQITIRNLVILYDIPEEALGLEPYIESIFLEPVVPDEVIYIPPPESIDLEPSVDSILLDEIVINYINPYESMSSEPDIDKIEIISL